MLEGWCLALLTTFEPFNTKYVKLFFQNALAVNRKHNFAKTKIQILTLLIIQTKGY